MLLQNGTINHFHILGIALELDYHKKERLYYTSVTYKRVSASSAIAVLVQFENTPEKNLPNHGWRKVIIFSITPPIKKHKALGI